MVIVDISACSHRPKCPEYPWVPLSAAGPVAGAREIAGPDSVRSPSQPPQELMPAAPLRTVAISLIAASILLPADLYFRQRSPLMPKRAGIQASAQAKMCTEGVLISKIMVLLHIRFPTISVFLCGYKLQLDGTDCGKRVVNRAVFFGILYPHFLAHRCFGLSLGRKHNNLLFCPLVQ